MMNFWIYVALSSSVLLPATAAFIRYKKVERDYTPFHFLLGAMVLQEALTLPVVLLRYSHAMITNTFMLVKVLLLVWQFYRWHLFDLRPALYRALMAGITAFWTGSTFLLDLQWGFNSPFIFFSSLLILVLTTNMMSRQIIRCNGPLLGNAIFLICAALLFFFTYLALVEIFWAFGLDKSRAFQVRIYTILSFVNLFTNLIYLAAVLCLPTKRPYFLLF